MMAGRRIGFGGDVGGAIVAIEGGAAGMPFAAVGIDSTGAPGAALTSAGKVTGAAGGAANASPTIPPRITIGICAGRFFLVTAATLITSTPGSPSAIIDSLVAVADGAAAEPI